MPSSGRDSLILQGVTAPGKENSFESERMHCWPESWHQSVDFWREKLGIPIRYLVTG